MSASTEVVIGIPIHYRDILSTFTRTWEAIPSKVVAEEQSHLEDRFDPKTGRPLGPYKAIDVARQVQPAVMAAGIFFSEQEYQDFLAGPGRCQMCLGVIPCPDKAHRQAYGQHDVQKYQEVAMPAPHHDSYPISEELVERLNLRDNPNEEEEGRFVVRDDGYRGEYYHFSLLSLRSGEDDSFSALDVVEAMPALGQLRALLLEAGLSNVPAATITPVFHE
jgi:hypothetical protein